MMLLSKQFPTKDVPHVYYYISSIISYHREDSVHHYLLIMFSMT